MSTYTIDLRAQAPFVALFDAPSGASADAQKIKEIYQGVFRAFANTATGSKRFADPVDQIRDVLRDGATANWDGCGAVPIPSSASDDAISLLLAFPPQLPVPDIYGEGTGSIVFEWYRRPGHRFLVTFPGDGSLEFAGLFGAGNEVFGRARKDFGVPQIIQDHLRALFAE